MKIKDIMSFNIISADINDSIQDVSKKMVENDIGFIPIKNKEEFIGVITDRDIVTKILANGDDKVLGYGMTNLITIDIDNTLIYALNIMKENKIKRLLVKDKKIVGIISLSDILKYVDTEILIESIKYIWAINVNAPEFNTYISEFEV